MSDIDTVRTVTRVENGTSELVAAISALPLSTDTALVIENLGAIERQLAAVCDGLAEVHERAALCDLISNSQGGTNTGLVQWMHADVALRTAASLAQGAADSLFRARHDGAVASWYDDIETDSRRG